ncbi:MAG: hypothetical protein PHW10_02665 [Candidatus Peribacteraceae bacterium]|nr:hypothetical protein [Candidatus Peribacteraceae bacterium]
MSRVLFSFRHCGRSREQILLEVQQAMQHKALLSDDEWRHLFQTERVLADANATREDVEVILLFPTIVELLDRPTLPPLIRARREMQWEIRSRLWCGNLDPEERKALIEADVVLDDPDASPDELNRMLSLPALVEVLHDDPRPVAAALSHPIDVATYWLRAADIILAG